MSKSVEELFKDAPDGTTHWDKGISRTHGFMKLENGFWFYWPSWSTDPDWDELCDFGGVDMADMIPRPQPKPWSGPEDGLPPVGIECEVENPLEDGQWCKVKILAWDAECAVFQAGADYPYVYDGQGLEGFRPFRTPEQLRESAIREFMDVVGIDCRVTASKAVDAGFKREVV